MRQKSLIQHYILRISITPTVNIGFIVCKSRDIPTQMSCPACIKRLGIELDCGVAYCPRKNLALLGVILIIYFILIIYLILHFMPIELIHS